MWARASSQRSFVRDHIPLEQGLRPGLRHRPPVESCQRPYSIRTRIKTILPEVKVEMEHKVRDHIPLEQGLRLIFFTSISSG